MNTFFLFVAAFAAALAAANAGPLEAACTVTSFSKLDDALKSCTDLIINGITVPAGETLKLDLKSGSTVTFQGTIKFDYSLWKGPLMQISGSKVKVIGTGATFNGQGEKYWDGKGDSGKTKPKFVKIKTTGGSKFTDIYLKNCPVQCVSISASDTTLSGWTIDVSAGDANELGHNTDGFDLSGSSNILIENAVVKNQDDCVAINQGYNYQFKNLTCSGGHGLSLSVGQSPDNGTPNTVQNVTFSDCTVKNSQNAIHVKTHSDAGTGAVKDVTYKNIKISGITKYGINVQEDYENGKSSGTPKGNIPITNLIMQNVQGSLDGSSSCRGVYILCGSNGCSNWKWSGISITNAAKSDSCNFSPSGYPC